MQKQKSSCIIPDSSSSTSYLNNKLFDVIYLLRADGEAQKTDYNAVEGALDSSYGDAPIIVDDVNQEPIVFSFLPDEYYNYSLAKFGNAIDTNQMSNDI